MNSTSVTAYKGSAGMLDCEVATSLSDPDCMANPIIHPSHHLAQIRRPRELVSRHAERRCSPELTCKSHQCFVDQFAHSRKTCTPTDPLLSLSTNTRARSRSLAMQLMSKGIRVNAVAREFHLQPTCMTGGTPTEFCFFDAAGPVYTPLQPASRTEDQMDGWGIGDIPLHGRVAQPAELG